MIDILLLVIPLSVWFGLTWHRLISMEARLTARIDQAIAGVRVAGHPAAQRQVDRQAERKRQSAVSPRPIQVD